MRGIGEQSVAHGAAGRAVLNWKVIRGGPVNGVVRPRDSANGMVLSESYR